jgi:hypothetical protein
MRVVKTPRLRGPASLMSAALPGLRSSPSFPESRAGPAHGGGRARSHARLVCPRIRAGKSSGVGASASGGQRPGVLCCRGGQRGEGAGDLFEPGRGYPVPAVTPWPDGKPEFAQQSTMRTLVCLAQCRCVVCGTEVAPGPIYRPADGEEAEFVAVALRFGKLKLYRNAAPTREGAGHRSCMIYSAIVCPYLASPGARRKFEIWLGPGAVPRGDPRGPSAAVVGTTTTPGTLAIRGWTSSTGSSLSFSATPAARTCSRNCTPRSPGNRSRPRRNLRTCWTMTPKSEPRGPCLKAAPLGLQLPAGRTGPGKAAARAPGAARRKNRCLCHDRT